MLVDCSDGGWGCERGGCEAATAAWTCLAQCPHFNIARAAVLECVKPDFHHLKTSMTRHIGNGSSRTYSVFLCRIKDAPGVCCNFNAIFEGNRVKISGSSERNESGSDKLRHLRECGMLLVPRLHVSHVFVRDVLQLRDHKLRKTAADAFKLQLRMLHNSRQDRKQDFEITHSLVLRHNESVGEHLRKVAQIALEQSDLEPQPFFDDGFADVRGNRGEICGEHEVTARAAPNNKNMRSTPASKKRGAAPETEFSQGTSWAGGMTDAECNLSMNGCSIRGSLPESCGVDL